MSLVLKNLDNGLKKAVAIFWSTRKKKKGGKRDVGQRGAVTSGKHLDGFIELIKKIVSENGLPPGSVKTGARLPTLPGFFRPTKKWDVLVIHNTQLIAAIEFKSQVGPSFGNNFNNRSEEAIGCAVDFQTAYREGAFGGNSPKPFLGFIMLLEDCSDSCESVKNDSPHFPVFPEFRGASYQKRYKILIEKLVKEALYTSASLLLTKKRSAPGKPNFTDSSGVASIKTFAATLAGHVAATALRKKI